MVNLLDTIHKTYFCIDSDPLRYFIIALINSINTNVEITYDETVKTTYENAVQESAKLLRYFQNLEAINPSSMNIKP